MHEGLYFDKWVSVVDNKLDKPSLPDCLVVTNDQWSILKELDPRYLLIIITVLNTFDSRIIGYGK